MLPTRSVLYCNFFNGNASHLSSDARLPRWTATWPISQPRKIWMQAPPTQHQPYLFHPPKAQSFLLEITRNGNSRGVADGKLPRGGAGPSVGGTSAAARRSSAPLQTRGEGELRTGRHVARRAGARLRRGPRALRDQEQARAEAAGHERPLLQRRHDRAWGVWDSRGAHCALSAELRAAVMVADRQSLGAVASVCYMCLGCF
jgi:hypothetical protein